MHTNIEIEYKMLLSFEQFNRLSEAYPDKTFKTQVNTYYDTADFQLRNKHCAMRIREIDNQFLFTLKVPKTEGHMEYECYVDKNNVQSLNKPEIQALLHQLNIVDEVKEITSLKTSRAVIELENAGLCFDISEYNGLCDYEIEYEWKKEHDGLNAFNDILSVIDVTYEKNCPSKIARAMNSL